MTALLQERLAELVALLVVIDPLSPLPIYLAIIGKRPASQHRAIALHAVLLSFGVLVLFIVGGQFLLRAIGVPLAAFQIAGGIILCLFAISMVFGTSTIDDEKAMLKQSPRQAATFPLAIPAIAGPGAMLTVVLLTDDSRHDVLDQIQTVAVLATVLAIQFVLFLFARPIQKAIGDAGTSVVTRVLGIILAAVAVTAVLSGLSSWLGLPPP